MLMTSCGSAATGPTTTKAVKPPKPEGSTTTANITTTTVASGTPQSTLPQASPIWMITYTAATKYLPAPLSNKILSNPSNYIIYGPRQHPGSWPSKSLADFKSYETLMNQFSLLNPNAIYGAVVDLENWSYTPVPEQRNPAMYYTMAGSKLHSATLKLVATPGLDLFKGLGQGPLYSLMLDSGLYKSVAKVADVVDIQAQSLENDPSAYENFVRQAAAQIRSVSPSVVILAGLTTSAKSGVTPSGQTLEVDARNVFGIVNGFWINVPSGGATCPSCSPINPQPAVTLLQSYLK